MRTLIRDLSGTLEDLVGLNETAGYISVVGQSVEEQMNRDYRAAFEVSQLSRQQVAQVLVDLKRRIDGKFYIIEASSEKIVQGAESPIDVHDDFERPWLYRRPKPRLCQGRAAGYHRGRQAGLPRRGLSQSQRRSRDS